MTTIIEEGQAQGAAQSPAPQQTPSSSNHKRSLKISEFIYLCASHWLWFVISLLICLALAFWYVKKTAPTYVRTASMMIKTDQNGAAMSGDAGIFQDLNIYSGNRSIADEMAMIKSPDLMRNVVRTMNLDTRYFVKGNFRDIELYGSSLPVTVTMPELPDDCWASFTLHLEGNGKFTMSDFKRDGKESGRGAVKGHLGMAMKTPFGPVTVSPAKNFNEAEDLEIQVTHTPVKVMASAFSGALKASMDEESWSIVNLSITENSPEKASDVLNGLIAAYNDRWIADKRELADNSSKFIDERIQLLQQELGSVDNDISSFKSSHLVPDVGAAAGMYMSQATQANLALKDLRNQEYMAKYIRNYLRNSDNSHKLLPSNAGISSTAISGMISQYNTKILERNSLVAQSSTTNPLVTNMDQDLSAMRGALVASIDNELIALSEQIKSQEGLSGHATSQIASNPMQARYLLSVERQQKVKETLYLYLLQKREENQLNQAFTSYNTRIIRQTDGPGAPIAPNAGNAYLIAFAAGILIPALILFFMELSVNVVRGRKDVKNLKTPFAGEIPFEGEKAKSFRVAGHHKDVARVSVMENSRNVINEAFRVVRTNVEFMLGNKNKSHVVMLTSANPGSGKTFITFNLAKSFAVKNKKVVMLDLDMRRAALSEYVEKAPYGIADYLANRVDNIDSIIQNVPDCENLYLVPVGTMPPNPTELLFSDRLHALIEDLKSHYDYVFIDCPPVEVVADASIISKHVDNTLFVIRAGLLHLDMLPVIEEYYLNNKYPNMSIILNGTVNPSSRYALKYGNPYSYGYGYGYGSTYRYNNDNK